MFVSSKYGSGYRGANVISGNRTGATWASGGGWDDGTSHTNPDALVINFNAAQDINEIDVFTVQDGHASLPPTETVTR